MRQIILGSLLMVAFVILVSASYAYANGETLYVRPAGGSYGSENGTSYANAWDGFANIVSNTVDTAGQFDPGDKLYICGTHTTQQLERYTDGTALLKFELDGSCPGDPGILNPTSNNFALYVEGSHYKIHDLNISRGVLGTVQFNPNGVGDYTLLGGIEFYNNVVHDTTHNTAQVFSYGTDNYYHHNTLRNANGAGFYHQGKRVRIAYNTIYDIDKVIGGDSVQLSFDMDGAIVEYNWSDRSRDIDLKACWTSSNTTDNGFVILRGNTCISNVDFDFGSGMYNETNILITGNIFYGGRNAMWCANTAGLRCDMIGNLVINPKQHAVQTAAVSTIDQVMNNTLIGSNPPRAIGITLDNPVATVKAQNNIIVGFTTGVEKKGVGGLQTESHNNFFNISGNNVTANGSPVSIGAGSITTDPQLLTRNVYAYPGTTASEYSLLLSSPDRRTGMFYHGCLDGRGRICNSPPDIGWMQMSPGDSAY